MVQVALFRVFGVLLLVVLAACARERPLATRNGRALTEGDFQRYLDSLYPLDERRSIGESPARWQAEVEQWLDRLAVMAKAERLGLEREPRFTKAVELMEMRALARLITEPHRTRIEALTRISQDEVLRFYEEHRGEYLTEPGFTARQVLVYVRGNPAFPERGLGGVAARAKARQALRQLRDGQSWDVVARRFSDDPSNRQRGGLIRDGRFGLFAPEVEQAVRVQELGKPGGLVKSVFGYHILQVESRTLERTSRPLTDVEPLIRERLAALHAEGAHEVLIDPIAAEVGLKVTHAGQQDLPLLDERAVNPNEVLAEMAGRKIVESDFRWFLEDAFPASQRVAVFSRPGARRNLLAAFLDELVLQAKARKVGFDKGPDFSRQRAAIRQKLLIEFVQEHDKTGPFCQCQQTPDERTSADRRYLDQLRAEAGIMAMAPSSSKVP